MTLQLEEGKFYRNRAGEKVGPVTRSPYVSRESGTNGEEYPWATGVGTDGESTYTDAGQFLANTATKCGADLVAEWDDDPASDTLSLMAPDATAEADDVMSDIVDEAGRIVSGARRSTYGQPEDNFERIARFWNAYLKNKGIWLLDADGSQRDLIAEDVSPMMRLLKEARLCETPDHYDSHVDLVGYALTGARVNGVKKSK